MGNTRIEIIERDNTILHYIWVDKTTLGSNVLLIKFLQNRVLLFWTVASFILAQPETAMSAPVDVVEIQRRVKER